MRIALALVGLAACGSSDDEASFEVVVEDARLGGASPVLVGATSSTVFWRAGYAIGGAAVESVPATGSQLAMAASAAIGQAGDFVAFVTEGRVSRVGADGLVARVAPGAPTVIGGNDLTPPVVAFVENMQLSWGPDDVQDTAPLSRLTTCDQVLVTREQIYVGGTANGGTRLLRVDQDTGTVTTVATSIYQAELFPGGGMTGATYTGRIVDVDDEAALWLVEEQPSKRAIVVRLPVRGDASVVVEYMQNAAGFFASDTTLYWQEGDTLLSAPRTGGTASIETELPGTLGAYADGYLYVTSGNTIERLRVE